MKKLIDHLKNVLGVSPAVFSRFTKEDNPLPIGTKAAYKLCRGKKVSRGQYLIIKDYLENYENTNNSIPNL